MPQAPALAQFPPMPVKRVTFQNEQQLRLPSPSAVSDSNPTALPARRKIKSKSRENQCPLKATPSGKRHHALAVITVCSGEWWRRPMSQQVSILTKYYRLGAFRKAAAFVFGLTAYLVFLVAF